MQQYRILTALFFALFLISGVTEEAQLSGLIQKSKDKAGAVIEKKADKNSGTAESKTDQNALRAQTDVTHGDPDFFGGLFKV